jgi:hypothetical protein
MEGPRESSGGVPERATLKSIPRRYTHLTQLIQPQSVCFPWLVGKHQSNEL